MATSGKCGRIAFTTDAWTTTKRFGRVSDYDCAEEPQVITLESVGDVGEIAGGMQVWPVTVNFRLEGDSASAILACVQRVLSGYPCTTLQAIGIKAIVSRDGTEGMLTYVGAKCETFSIKAALNGAVECAAKFTSPTKPTFTAAADFAFSVAAPGRSFYFHQRGTTGVQISSAQFQSQSWEVAINHNLTHVASGNGAVTGLLRNFDQVIEGKQDVTVNATTLKRIPNAATGMDLDDLVDTMTLAVTITNKDTPAKVLTVGVTGLTTTKGGGKVAVAGVVQFAYTFQAGSDADVLTLTVA